MLRDVKTLLDQPATDFQNCDLPFVGHLRIIPVMPNGSAVQDASQC